MVNIKGYEFRHICINDSYNRRAQQWKNRIISNLKIFGLTADDIEIPLDKIMIKKAQASVSWFMWDRHLFYSYSGSEKFVENLAMTSQVIEHFISLLRDETITPEDFIKTFAEDVDILKQRKAAREVLGVDENSTDFEQIHRNYKNLSKNLHPDMPNGNTEEFKRINNAHKILRKELSDNTWAI